jgi:hypothetical protein
MQARCGYRRRETAEERERIQVHRHRAVRERLLERDPDETIRPTGHPFLRDRGAQYVLQKRLPAGLVVPAGPDAARDLNLPETECKVLIKFDEQGTPFELEFKACPKVFQEAARTAIMNSRMYPQKVAGAAVKGQFVLNLLFKLT